MVKMKSLSVIILVCSSLISLISQEEQSSNFIRSTEISLGIGKVGILNNTEFLVNSDVCTDFCILSIMQNPGNEISTKFLTGFMWNQRHEFLGGIGLNIWSYDVDFLDNLTSEKVGEGIENVTAINFMLGYRLGLIRLERSTFFVEALPQAQMIFADKFVALMTAIEPGIGYRFDVNPNLSFNTVLAYKIGLNDISNDNLGEIHKANVISLRMGIKKTF